MEPENKKPESESTTESVTFRIEPSMSGYDAGYQTALRHAALVVFGALVFSYAFDKILRRFE